MRKGRLSLGEGGKWGWGVEVEWKACWGGDGSLKGGHRRVSKVC